MKIRLKKYVAVFMAIIFMLVAASFPVFADEGEAELYQNEKAAVKTEGQTAMPVKVNAKAAVLMDFATGKVLMAMNEHQKLYPASVTKVMPMLLVMEAIDSGKIKLTDMVTASGTAASKGGSQIWLKEGETMSVDDLLKATAIYSANDACTALGEFLAGSSEGFVKMMNERAKQLGMKETNFVNCTGLDDDTDAHLTSAYDIAVMSRELLKHKLITNYTTVWMDSLRNGETELVNTNKVVQLKSNTLKQCCFLLIQKLLYG